MPSKKTVAPPKASGKHEVSRRQYVLGGTASNQKKSKQATKHKAKKPQAEARLIPTQRVDAH